MVIHFNRVQEGTKRMVVPVFNNLPESWMKAGSYNPSQLLVTLEPLAGGNLVFGTLKMPGAKFDYPSGTYEDELHVYFYCVDNKEPNTVDKAFWRALSLCHSKEKSLSEQGF